MWKRIEMGAVGFAAEFAGLGFASGAAEVDDLRPGMLVEVGVSGFLPEVGGHGRVFLSLWFGHPLPVSVSCLVSLSPLCSAYRGVRL